MKLITLVCTCILGASHAAATPGVDFHQDRSVFDYQGTVKVWDLATLKARSMFPVFVPEVLLSDFKLTRIEAAWFVKDEWSIRPSLQVIRTVYKREDGSQLDVFQIPASDRAITWSQLVTDQKVFKTFERGSEWSFRQTGETAISVHVIGEKSLAQEAVVALLRSKSLNPQKANPTQR